MPILFNTLLKETGVEPSSVRLIRHKDKRARRGCTPYELWRDCPEQFEVYQSIQSISNRPKLHAQYWASFVVNGNDDTIFAGLYSANYKGLLEEDTPMPHMDGIDKAGECDAYSLCLQDQLSDFVGKLIIDWGGAAIAWIQYADRNDKVITELHKEFKEPEFPGFLNFIQQLSKLDNLPLSWISALKSSRGIYLLTCPRTKEQYVGSATGIDGFWGRWQMYIHDGHGGNVGLKSREASDYQVSIIEVAGTSLSQEDILAMESKWKLKLQSREMGLNKN